MHDAANLERGLTSLRSSAAHPGVIAWLARVVTTGSDLDCYQINPFRVAEELGVDRLDATRTLLFATRLGLTDLTWDIHCPSCAGQPEYHRHLMQLAERAHCPLCDLRWDLSLEDQLAVSFTVNADLRPIDLARFREQAWPAARDLLMQRLARDGRFPALGLPLPTDGSTATASGALAAGRYFYEAPGHPDGRGELIVEGEPCPDEQPMRVHCDAHGGMRPASMRLRPGPVRLELTSDYPRADWGMHVRIEGPPRDWVSAAYVTSLQDFRDLFAGEYLAADRSFAVRSVTLMFTDIKGSTELYEQLGDARAYALVQRHFELMTGVIRRRQGGIVKTIGDAVMAAFPVHREGVLAALEIQDAFRQVEAPLDAIVVKIGLHRGPTIAVTSNRALDYFGRTVNFAARIQGASAAGEVLASQAAMADPGLLELLAARAVVPRWRTVNLKGIGEVLAAALTAEPGLAGASRPAADP